MRNRVVRPLVTMLSILVAFHSSVQADPISITHVVQVIDGTNRTPDLRVRNVDETGSLRSNTLSTRVSTSTSTAKADGPSLNVSEISIAGATATAPARDSLLAGIALDSDDTQTFSVISQGDLEGSICDCGEIPVAEGHFPKWPLLFLAAVPFFFIHHKDCDTCATPPPPPPPPPFCENCNVVPEPASLLLMGSGLAALATGLRRRYARTKLEKATAATEEA